MNQVRLARAGKMYERLLVRCNTPNEVNALQISLGNRLTPAEMEVICRSDSVLALRARAAAAWARSRIAPRATDGSHAWKLQMLHFAACSGRKRSEPYLRRRFGRNMVFYSDGGESKTKTLVVCLTGFFHRMMVPIPSFLQNLPASRYDVLMLKDSGRKAYTEGLPDIPGRFEGLLENVKSIADRGSYASAVGLGVSYGGVPALVLSAQLGFDKGVSIGGLGRDRYRRSDAALARAVDELEHSSAPLLLVYGYDSHKDRDVALSFDGLASVDLLAVRSRQQGEIGHNPLDFLLRKRRLAIFLETALDPRTRGYADAEGRHAGVLQI